MIRNHSIFGVLHFSGPTHLVAPCTNRTITSLLNAAPNFVEALLGIDPVQCPLRIFENAFVLKARVYLQLISIKNEEHIGK